MAKVFLFKHVEVLITLEQFSSGKFRHFTNKRIYSQIRQCISKRIFSQKSYYCYCNCQQLPATTSNCQQLPVLESIDVLWL